MASSVWGIGKGSPLAGRHLAMTQFGRTPASTILLISTSPMTDGTHSLLRLALAATFFGFLAPFFGAISQIWFGIGGGSACESRSARVEEEDEMVKWQRWERGCGSAVIKHSPNLSHSRVFGKPLPRFAPLRILQSGLLGRYLGFRVITA